MAISRSKMNRQLREGGGIMNVARREQFGLGSKLKRFVRKVIPNEISKVAVKAAPFVAPFNPALAGAMAGIGSFDQTGSLSDAFKSGALTYGGGQAARFIGGAGFQQNPFTQGGAFRGGLEGFKGGFSSPLGTETGLGKFFNQRKQAQVGKAIKEQGEIQSLGVPEASEGAISTTSVVDNQTQFLPTDLDTTPLNIESDLVKKVNITSDKTFLEKITSGEPDQIFDAVTDAVKKGGKAIFTKQEDGKTVLDKTALLAAGSFGLTYLDAKKIANEAGEELTVEEYDEATKADKKEEYAGYLQNFFAGKKDGGRIGYGTGSRPSQLFKLLEEAQAAGDDDKIKEIKSDLFREFGLKLAKGGRIELAGGTGRKSKYKPDMKVKQIDPLQEDFGFGGYKYKGGIGGGGSPFSKAAIAYLFRTLGKTGGKDRKFTMPNLYKILNNPGKFPKDEEALAAFLKIKGFKEGGRAELAMGSEVPIRKNKAGIEELDYRQSGGFVPIGIKEKADDVPAMLSKNEFVMTADAVRGIGDGSVERGAEKLYNVMKQAEKVGKA
jgi:hypothetical protein